VQKEKEQREKTQREKVQKEKEHREKTQREKVQKEKEQPEKTQREKAQKEKEQREKKKEVMREPLISQEILDLIEAGEIRFFPHKPGEVIDWNSSSPKTTLDHFISILGVPTLDVKKIVNPSSNLTKSIQSNQIN